jgi:hypothetical protein
MYIIIPTLLIAIICFIGGVYFERSNSIAKVRPIKKAMTNVNDGRTIVVDRTNK